MFPDRGAFTFDFVGERLELAGNVLLDYCLLDLACTMFQSRCYG